MANYDPELKYCQKCGDEYRREFEYCSSCRERLLSGEEMSHNDTRSSDKLKYVEIGKNDVVVSLKRGTLIEMKNLKRHLRSSGIASLLVTDPNCGGGCCGPEMVLQVRAEDSERAAAVIQEEHASATRLDDFKGAPTDALFNPLASQTTCPACGHNFQPNRPDCPECGLCFC